MYIEVFQRYIQFEKRFSHHTFTAYSADLTAFFAFIEQEYQLTDIVAVTHTHIRSWMVALMNDGIGARTITRKITTLKTYFKFLLREKYIDYNPMGKVRVPKIARRLPVFVNQPQIEQLLEEIPFPEGFAGVRDKLVVELLYATGMRLSELIGIQDADINFYESTIKVLGKRNKERLIPFNKKIEITLKSYLELKKQIVTSIDTPKQPLIVTDKGQQAYSMFIYRLVNHYLSMVTTIDKKSPHVLRHTFATHLLNNGADLNAIKELLGHANLAATQVYTHNSIEKLKNIYKQAHPKA